MKRVTGLGTALALLLAMTGTSQAGVIFDNSVAQQDLRFETNSAQGAAAQITPSADTVISGFAVQTQYPSAAQTIFFIADATPGSQGVILYQSPAQSFAADSGPTFKNSPALNFTLLAGHIYDLGSVSTLEPSQSYFVYWGDPVSQNGLTVANSVADLYLLGANDSIQFFGGAGFTPAIRIFGETSAVPEPSSIALLGMGAVGLLGYGRRRRK